MDAIGLGFSLTWLGHSAFHLVSPGGVSVLLDPWLTGNPRAPKGGRPERVDLILLSHGHGDHFGDTVALARQHGCPVFCVHELSLHLMSLGVERAEGMGKGGSLVHAGLRVTATHAVHSSSADANEPDYKTTGEPLGFVITFENGRRLYFAGDTGPMADMAVIRDLYAPDVALLPIGDRYTMGPFEAAWAAQQLGVRFVVPMHYGTFDVLTGTVSGLREAMAARGVLAEVVAPEPGERVT